jgi:hypothetical protein
MKYQAWLIIMAITILDIIHCPVIYLKHNVSETSSIGWDHLKMEIEFSLQNVMF